MLISKQQLACRVCGNDEREALQSICFDQRGAVSTDGKRILIVPYPVNANQDLFETEEAKADAKFKLAPGQKILVHEEQAKQIAAAFFKGDGSDPGVRFAAMEQKETGEKLISMVNPEQKIRKEFLLDESFDGGFPNYLCVIPKSEVTLEINVSLNLLLDLLTQMKKARGDSAAEFVNIKFHGERGIFELTLGEDEHAIRAFMAPAMGKKD